MKLNCDAANKLVKHYRAEREALIRKETNNSTYTTTMEMRAEDAPDYDFAETNAQIEKLTEAICKLKHAINIFNTSTVLPMGYTIDEALVRMAVLSETKCRLERLRGVPEKKRTRTIGLSDKPEYVFRNFPADQVEDLYQKACTDLIELQQALNRANLTNEFEVDINL